MISRSQLLLSLLSFSILISSVESAKLKTVISSSQREARRQQQLQEERNLQNNNKNNDKNNNDKDNDKNSNVATVNTRAPTLKPTEHPTQQPTEYPTLSPVTPHPTLPPTDAPVDLPTVSPREVESSSISLSMDDLKEIQYFGGTEITLRLSLWFQDRSSASQVSGGAVEQAVLKSLHSLICQEDTAEEANQAHLEFMTLFDKESNPDEEDRELCVVDTELHNSNNQFRQVTEGSILFQPPNTVVIDQSQEDLQWTTWRITWDVMRLGTSYILQGLENAGEDVGSLTQEQIYRAGVQAMQGILELALQVSIREQSYDQLIVANMGTLGQEDLGVVLASVYGEEVQTFEPKLEWLGLAQATDPSDGSATVSGNAQAGPAVTFSNDPADVIPPTVTTTATDSSSSSVQVVEIADGEDDGYDDDRYSDEYGITEPIDPPFWHPLRIVGILMFIFTTMSLVGLSYLSKRRQALRELERKMAKEGLLNNPQGVEDMLRASVRDPVSTKSKTQSQEVDDSQDMDEEEEGFNIPMPINLKAN
ncbi:expressed unknown protein [Seminavis robusta]|uniref:Uncharacterized protein n=1 Tax=Seminavis robusta TaxID=568900 RepID=A0A9N8H2Y0_9STRA|nr:expressed unknown protein [Seminavis robusta]|eukprot:Sro75_g041350.1 n/a (535) ;mRNA; r:90745-92349